MYASEMVRENLSFSHFVLVACRRECGVRVKILPPYPAFIQAPITRSVPTLAAESFSSFYSASGQSKLLPLVRSFHLLKIHIMAPRSLFPNLSIVFSSSSRSSVHRAYCSMQRNDSDARKLAWKRLFAPRSHLTPNAILP